MNPVSAISIASVCALAALATPAAAQETGRSKLVTLASQNSPSSGVDGQRRILAEARPIADPQPFMFGLFNAQKPQLEPLTEEQADNDEKWASLAKKRNYRIKEEFAPTTVSFRGFQPGTIVIDTKNKYLYFVESPATAIRYGIAVGKEGLTFTGETMVGDKQPWPRWTPTKSMIERNPGQYRRYEDGMDGGLKNPLGARAIYLHQGRNDTYLRIHGTNDPASIGTASSNGCFRMHNEHVIDLYGRVKMGAKVVIL